METTTLCYIERAGQYLMLHRVKKECDVNRDKWVGIGGHIEPGETPEQCLLREVRQETGLTLTRYRACGEICFESAPWPPELMYLYHADGFKGELLTCDEGELVWLDRAVLRSLPAWEGDFIFLELMERRVPYFRLSLHYGGERLDRAVLDGRSLPLPDWRGGLED